MAQLFYNKQPFTGSSSTSAAAGYPAANATFESVSRHWRSNSAGVEEWVGTFAAALAVNTFCLHDVNFAAATIQKSVDGVVFVTVGVMTTYADRHGRRRGRILINDANVKAIKVQIAAGTPTDSTNAGYWAGVTPVWRIGAAYAFASTVTPSGIPAYSYRRSTRRPRVTVGIANGGVSWAKTGENVDTITLTFLNQYSEVVDDFIARASLGTIWLDMGVAAAFPEQQWPVRLVGETIDEDYQRPLWYAISSLPFLETV